MRNIVVLFLFLSTGRLCAEEFPTFTMMDLACRSQFIVEAKFIKLKDVVYRDRRDVAFPQRVLLIEIQSILKSDGTKLPDTLQIQVNDNFDWGSSLEFLDPEKALLFLTTEFDQWYGTKGLLWYVVFSGILISKNDSLYIPSQPSTVEPYMFRYWPSYKNWGTLMSGLKRGMEATEILPFLKQLQPAGFRNRALLIWTEYFFPALKKDEYCSDWTTECSKDALKMIFESGLEEDMLEALMWYQRAGRIGYWSGNRSIVPPFCSPKGRMLLLNVAIDTRVSQKERDAAMYYLNEYDTNWPSSVGTPLSKEEQMLILSAMIKILEEENVDMPSSILYVIQTISLPPPFWANQKNDLAVQAVIRYYQMHPSPAVKDLVFGYLSHYLPTQEIIDLNDCDIITN